MYKACSTERFTARASHHIERISPYMKYLAAAHLIEARCTNKCPQHEYILTGKEKPLSRLRVVAVFVALPGCPGPAAFMDG